MPRPAAPGSWRHWGAGAGLIIVLFGLAWVMQPVETPATSIDMVARGGLLLMFGGPVGAVVVFLCARSGGRARADGRGHLIAVLSLAIYTWALAWVVSFTAGDLMCGADLGGDPCGTTVGARMFGIIAALLLWSLYASLESLLSRRYERPN